MISVSDILLQAGIHPSAQRVAIGEFVLNTDTHPSAEQVLIETQKRLPRVSVATIYNTLHLLVEHGLLRTLEISSGHTVYDPCLACGSISGKSGPCTAVQELASDGTEQVPISKSGRTG